MHWLMVGICIGLGLVFARLILILFFWLLPSLVMLALWLIAVVVPAFIVGLIKGYAGW